VLASIALLLLAASAHLRISLATPRTAGYTRLKRRKRHRLKPRKRHRMQQAQ